MSKELEFFIFLLEKYAAHKNTSADHILRKWDEYEVTDFIFNMYERYHTERLENAFEDIDKILIKKYQNCLGI